MNVVRNNWVGEGRTVTVTIATTSPVSASDLALMAEVTAVIERHNAGADSLAPDPGAEPECAHCKCWIREEDPCCDCGAPVPDPGVGP